MRRDLILGLTGVVVLGAGSVTAAHQIRGFVMGSGAGSATGASHTIHYSVGQSVAGTATGAVHGASSGFWGASPHVTSVESGQPPSVPGADQLLQNNPNPFNPSTTIRYDLASPGHVRLKIYDVRGQLVTTLVDAIQTPGQKSVVWRGQDEHGEQVASGIYLYVLETPRERFVKKMVLVQ